MARARNYDDLDDNKVSRGGNSSTKLILAVIAMSILICAVAVLVWVKILETQDAMAGSRGSDSGAAAVAEAADPSVQIDSVAETQPSVEDPGQQIDLSLSIDEALNALGSSAPSTSTVDADYLTSSDYGSVNVDDADVSEQSVEMKKPAIAQNLQLSRQSSFSKDMVKYQEYTIKANDTLNSIAESFGLSLQTIVSVNQITSAASLWIGSTLQIPDRDGSLYIVKEGDSFSSIIRQYGLAMGEQTLGEVNGLKTTDLTVGQKLFIPYETIDTSGTMTASAEVSFERPSSDAMTVGIYNQKVVDPLTESSMQLDGILLQASAGTGVYATESGTVIDKGFNENGSGFVKIMHPNGYTSYYDYLADILVETTDKVEKGQRIGSFGDGMTKTDAPVVFFQIKQDGIPFDPESFFD